MTWFLIVWLFCLGACVGSFLNVVIYRVPAGKSLSRPGSHCPKCGHAIRPYDNVPMLGWLCLRGRCRDCKAPIAARYPLVEALIACIFLGLGIAEIGTGGMNLPLPSGNLPELNSIPSEWELGCTYAAHVWLVCSLVAAAFMCGDGHSPPRRYWLFVIGVGLGLSLLPLVLKPVPVSSHLREVTWLVGLVGAVAGALVGFIVAPLVGRYSRVEMGSAALAGALCGSVIGWQGAVLLIPVATALWLADAALSRALTLKQRMPWLAYVAACALLYIVEWPLVNKYVVFPV